MDKFFIVENGMISEDYILAPNIECALKHAHLKHNMHDKVIDKIKIKRKEDLVDAKCVAYDETSLQNSLNHCPNIRLISLIPTENPRKSQICSNFTRKHNRKRHKHDFTCV